jgi:hypothetical protein
MHHTANIGFDGDRSKTNKLNNGNHETFRICECENAWKIPAPRSINMPVLESRLDFFFFLDRACLVSQVFIIWSVNIVLYMSLFVYINDYQKYI